MKALVYVVTMHCTIGKGPPIALVFRRLPTSAEILARALPIHANAPPGAVPRLESILGDRPPEWLDGWIERSFLSLDRDRRAGRVGLGFSTSSFGSVLAVHLDEIDLP